MQTVRSWWQSKEDSAYSAYCYSAPPAHNAQPVGLTQPQPAPRTCSRCRTSPRTLSAEP